MSLPDFNIATTLGLLLGISLIAGLVAERLKLPKEVFQRVADDCLPVVSREEPHTLLGVVRRAEFTHLLIHRHRSTKDVNANDVTRK